MAYATTTELATYLFVDESDLPDDADRLLQRASELMDYITLNRIDTDNTAQATAAEKAVCAQYEWWAESGDELGLAGKVNSISLGEFSYSAGNESTNKTRVSTVAPRAMQYLFLEGLLYKGVSMR